jgi:hypothetical protein
MKYFAHEGQAEQWGQGIDNSLRPFAYIDPYNIAGAPKDLLRYNPQSPPIGINTYGFDPRIPAPLLTGGYTKGPQYFSQQAYDAQQEELRLQAENPANYPTGEYLWTNPMTSQARWHMMPWETTVGEQYGVTDQDQLNALLAKRAAEAWDANYGFMANSLMSMY